MPCRGEVSLCAGVREGVGHGGVSTRSEARGAPDSDSPYEEKSGRHRRPECGLESAQGHGIEERRDFRELGGQIPSNLPHCGLGEDQDEGGPARREPRSRGWRPCGTATRRSERQHRRRRVPTQSSRAGPPRSFRDSFRARRKRAISAASRGTTSTRGLRSTAPSRSTTVKGSPSSSRYFSRKNAGRVRVPRPRTWIVIVVIPESRISGFLGAHATRRWHRGTIPSDAEGDNDLTHHDVSGPPLDPGSAAPIGRRSGENSNAGALHWAHRFASWLRPSSSDGRSRLRSVQPAP